MSFDVVAALNSLDLEADLSQCHYQIQDVPVCYWGVLGVIQYMKGDFNCYSKTPSFHQFISALCVRTIADEELRYGPDTCGCAYQKAAIAVNNILRKGGNSIVYYAMQWNRIWQDGGRVSRLRGGGA